MLTFCRLAAGRAGALLGRRHRLVSAHASPSHASPSHTLSSLASSSHVSSSSDSPQLSSHSSQPTTSPDHDYLGIMSDLPDPPLPRPPSPPLSPDAAMGESRMSVDELAERLMQRQRRRGRPGEEAVIAVSFGVIRLDGDNQPLVHGQFEPGVMEGLSAGDVDSGLAEAMAERPAKSRVAWRDERSGDVVSVNSVGGDVSGMGGGAISGSGAMAAGSSIRSGKVASSGVTDSELDFGDTYHALGLIDSQYFPDVPAETPAQKTSESAADREPARVPTTTLDSPPVDLFDEQYFAAAFAPATSSPTPSASSSVSSASTVTEATVDEPLPTLPPSSPLRGLQEDVAVRRIDSHVVSEGGNGVSVSGGGGDATAPLGKLDGRPQGVFEEQYFWSAFEDTEEQRETERYKAGLAARHGEPPPRQGGSTEVKSTSGAPRWLGVSDSDGADGAVTDIGGVWPEEMVVPSPVAGPRTTASASPPPPPTQRPTAKAAEANAAPSKSVKAAKAKAAPSEPTPAAKRQAGPAAATATAAARPGVRTALDAALEMRAAAAAARSDATSRGRQLRAERTDLSSLPSEAVLTMLRRGILHDAGDFVILYKPSGMSVHSATERYPHCLTDQLPELARIIGCERLLTVHRLDRDTSGALMLAKTTEAAHRLSGLLREGRVQKTYWALVRGEPELPRGVVDMPLELMTVAGRQRMGVPAEGSGGGGGTAPDGAQKAITRYRMLARGSGCALLELTPATGVRHQLRAHLGLGLGCPVLGDHKYSRWDTASRPQRLPPSTLTALGLRAAEARHIPMHLHARALWMPGLQHRVTAPLPVFFKRNLKRLKMAEGTVKGDGRYASKEE